jgi:hypothetical protein
LTRRAGLGAAFAVPPDAAVGDAGAAAPDAASWHRALADVERAEAVLNGFCRACREEGLAFPDQWELDDRFGDFLDAFHAALGLLLRTPAPDMQALAAKIALVADHEVGALADGQRCLAALEADARRLAAASLG